MLHCVPRFRGHDTAEIAKLLNFLTNIIIFQLDGTARFENRRAVINPPTAC